ncbi:DUF6221 family protein [Streptomyces sp. NPDC055055]
MDDLIAFLRARLDEDEQTARAAKPGPWHTDGGDVYARDRTDAVVGHTDSAEHIARHNPARVMAEVYSKRQLLDSSAAACAPACGSVGRHSFDRTCALRWMGPVEEADGGQWVRDDTGARFAAPPVTPEWVFRVLALPYAGHPDYRSTWSS